MLLFGHDDDDNAIDRTGNRSNDLVRIAGGTWETQEGPFKGSKNN
jgi:hypothetical protein